MSAVLTCENAGRCRAEGAESGALRTRAKPPCRRAPHTAPPPAARPGEPRRSAANLDPRRDGRDSRPPKPDDGDLAWVETYVDPGLLGAADKPQWIAALAAGVKA